MKNHTPSFWATRATAAKKKALTTYRAQEIAGSATVKIGEKVHEIGIAGKQ
nr:factor H binding protein domain-containing protein [Neisseria viridiae]